MQNKELPLALFKEFLNVHKFDKALAAFRDECNLKGEPQSIKKRSEMIDKLSL